MDDEAVLFGDKDAPNVDSKPPFAAARHRKFSKTGNLLEDRSQPLNLLDHTTNDPLVNALRKTRDTIQSCPALWADLAKLCGDKRALLDEHLCDTTVDLTFNQMEVIVKKSAAVFQKLGIKTNDKVAVFAENSAYWLVADHGLQMAGGASAVRGADAPCSELRYIYEHSDSRGIAVLQNTKLLQKLVKDAKAQNMEGLGLSNDAHGPVKTIVLLHKEKATDEQLKEFSTSLNIDIYVLSELLEKTKPMSPVNMPTLTKDNLSTIVYTSGTTGSPKGVMLSHGNLLHQLQHRLGPSKKFAESEPIPGDTMLSLLPVWHITERTFELWMVSRGCHVVYSTIRTFKNDLAKYQPQWMVLVPRVLEKVATGIQNKLFKSGSAAAQKLVAVFVKVGKARAHHQKIVAGLVVRDQAPSSLEKARSAAALVTLALPHAVGQKLVWSKVQAGFGGRQKLIISGGSALSGALEDFYDLCGVPVVVGYGLTECSPLIAHRRSDANLITAGCVGKPTLDTEIRIVDQNAKPGFTERPALPEGEVGVVVVRGPQVMRGYYKNPEATDKAIDRFNWFDTGDLGRVNPATGDIILTGRCKDTIVLSNGENIEPSPIEDSIMSESSIIEQVMLTGQDGRSLTAIAVLNPTELVAAGFMDKKEGQRLQKLYDHINDPQCTSTECEEACAVLKEAADELKSNDSLVKLLKSDMARATSNFRKWEQVGDILITLEPFAMVNGLLTQSYKVKRDGVLQKYYP
jgi:long-chain acyl-CoA synthetase